MSRTLRFHGILVAAALSLTGVVLHTAQPATTVQADTAPTGTVQTTAGGDSLIWD